MTAIAEYPVGGIKLTKFFGPDVHMYVDGARFENHRLDVVFPSDQAVKTAIARLVKAAMPNREDAVKFILTVLDEYQAFGSGPVNTKEITG